MSWLRRLAIPVFVVSLGTVVAGCGDTWDGIKKDTGDNMQKSGNALEDAGRKVKQ